MRTWITLLLVSAAALTISAAPPADVHAAIRHYREALKAKDLAALETIWTDDYVFVNGHGQLRTKSDRLADIRSGASSIDSITHEEAPIVKTQGKTTLVLSRVTIVGTYSGHKVAHDFRSLHVWINEDGRWRLVFNQLTAVE
jgi:ketosteroid isomerase-like protein